MGGVSPQPLADSAKKAFSVARALAPAVNRRATNRRRLQAGSHDKVRAESVAEAPLGGRLARSVGFEPHAGRRGTEQAYLNGIGREPQCRWNKPGSLIGLSRRDNRY